MAEITVTIPEGLDESQRADLAAWLSRRAAEAVPQRLPIEDDPAFQDEVARRIAAGMADADAGRMMTSDQARARLDARLGRRSA